MTEVATWRPHGAPCWVSLLVHDLEATRDFYGNLFGWQFEYRAQPFAPYVRAVLNGRPIAGLGEMPPDRRMPVAWTTYFASDDVDATTARIRSCGGTVAVGPLDAAEAGRMSIASDPLGAIFGVWQPKDEHGVELTGEPGTLAWNELLTVDASMAGRFYASVFGCETERTTGTEHTAGPGDTALTEHTAAAGDTAADSLTLRVDGRPVAGIVGVGRTLPRERGPHWMTCFAVKDTDDAARQVTELGGRVLRPPRDGGYGRVATVADGEGAVFTVVQADGRPG